MITDERAVADTADRLRRLRSSFDIPVSLLITPTILGQDDLERFKAAGADKIGVAVDLATPALFDRYRGSGVDGPHQWEAYWDCLRRAIGVFGEGHAGVHLMVGMGETEQEMCAAIQRAKDMGGRTHLFSFFPEPGSAHGRAPPAVHGALSPCPGGALPDRPRPRRGPTGLSYTRAARSRTSASAKRISTASSAPGEPFRTSGCEGTDGEVACNRPFANSRPGPNLRNYPFPPTMEDLDRIRLQMSRKRMVAPGR